jgi:hypothetical protein
VANFKILFFGLISGSLFLQVAGLSAQTTMEALEKALLNTRNQHETTSKNLIEQFHVELDRAVSSPAAALAFYETGGGSVPPAPNSLFQHLRPDRDKKERSEIAAGYQYDTSMAVLAYCEMLRFAFRSATGVEAAQKSAAWPAWLEKQMRQFGSLNGTFLEGNKMGESAQARHFGVGGVFRNKKEADWRIGAVPDLYREFVMGPLAAQKSPKTAESWDLYMAVMETRSGNPMRWENVEKPRLLFQKSTALFEMAPHAVELTRMVEILQNFPQHPDFASMQKKAEECLKMLKDAPKAP